MNDNQPPRSLESAPEAIERIVDAIRGVISPEDSPESTTPSPVTPEAPARPGEQATRTES